MKKQKSILIISVFILTIYFSNCSKDIKYGSNNGNFLNIRGTKLYYEEYGKGMPVILLHGGFGSISDFKKFIPGLSENYRVIVPDAPGQGRSDHADSVISYRLMEEYYSAMTDQLIPDSAYVIGWSDGGVAALLLAVNRPDKIKKVIAAGANYRADGVKKEVIEFNESKLCNIEWAEANNKAWIEKYKNMSPQNDWKRYLSETKLMWSEEEYFPKADLEKINIPVLLIYGDKDVITKEHEDVIHSSIRNSKLQILPNTSHNIFAEQPELLIKIADEFFNLK